jgi:perosamine synthetase
MTIRPMQAADAEAVARIHIEAINTAFIASLGPRFVTALYREIPRSTVGFGFVALEQDSVAGFIACAEDVSALYRRVLTRRGIFFALVLARHFLRWRTVKRMLETLFYPAKKDHSDLCKPEILSVGIESSQRGKGVAKQLMAAALDGFRQRGIREVKVLTHDINDASNAYYAQCGFALVGSVKHHENTLNIYHIALNDGGSEGDEKSDLPLVLLSAPSLRGNEQKYVMDCLKSEWVSTSGEYVSRFESKLAEYARTESAVSCVNGTAALHMCLILTGAQRDEEVIVPALTFIAPVNAVRYVGAHPVFMDCDDFLNMDMNKLRQFLKEECQYADGILVNGASGRRIRAIIPVHVFGALCEMDKLMELSREYGLCVIEDATEALGSRMTEGNWAGAHAGTIGDFGCLSFNGNKIITSGGGGMILSRDSESLERAKYLTTQAKDDALHYIHNEVGYNYRLTAFQAAMGLAQLEQLPDFIKRKKQRYRQYREAVSDIDGLRILEGPSYCDSNCWFYSLFIEDAYPLDRDTLMARMEEERIQTRPIWHLNNEQRPYLDCQAYRVAKARYYLEHLLNLPCSVGLTDEDLERVVKTLSANAR